MAAWAAAAALRSIQQWLRANTEDGVLLRNPAPDRLFEAGNTVPKIQQALSGPSAARCASA
ncbi:hypothetical protein GCM10009776_22800 [Microbacterium deminutum]|uniref:Uncharacterized protein n=1 Tax=Microbacterium deminutum TaxID=344164 RepID=A0ABP5C8A6_9MICO